MTKHNKIVSYINRYNDDINRNLCNLVLAVSIVVWGRWNILQLGVLGEGFAIAINREVLVGIIKSTAAVGVLFPLLSSIYSYVEARLFFRRKSSIVFTESDKKRYEKERRSRGIYLFKVVAVWIITLASGVISNVIYSKNWFW